MQILPITLAAAGARAGLQAGTAVIDQAGSFARQLAGFGRTGLGSAPQSAGDPHSALLAEAAGLSAAGGSASGGAVTLTGLREQLNNLLGTAHQQFTSLLEQAGATADPPVQLQLDPATGTFVVPADHPHRTEIDALLAENPDLTNQFRRILALQSLLQAADSQSGTQLPETETTLPGGSSGRGVLSLRLDRHEARVERS